MSGIAPVTKMCTCDKFIICALITTLMFVNIVNCTSLDLPDQQLQDKLLETACKLKCSTIIPTTTNNCDCDDNIEFQSLPILNVNDTFLYKMICKESNKVVFKVCDSNQEKNHYFLEYRQHFDEKPQDKWKYITRTNSCYLVADKLNQNTEYKFRLWVSSINGIVYQPVESNYVSTKRLKDTPQPPTAIDLLRFEYSEEQNDYQALLIWRPSPDASCHYEFVWFGGDDVSDYTQLEIEIPFNFTITINKLLFNSNYSVAVMTKNTDWSLESEKVWYHFTTPPCLTVLKSLDYCTPEQPTGIDTEEHLILINDDTRLYDIRISWDLPVLQPDWYLVHLNTFEYDQNENSSYINVTGNETEVEYKGVSLGLHYQVTIFAHSKAGRSEPAEYYKQINPNDVIVSTLKINNNVFLIFVLPFAIIFCIIAFLLFGYKEFSKRRQIIKRQRYFEELELKSHYLDTPMSENNEGEKDDEWEIDASCLTLHSVLGRGAFGIVRKGWLQKGNNKIAVAVKMLLDDHRYADMRDFKQEIEIMKSVGSHPHIVSLIGCCSKNKPSELRLIVEYCARGDLLTYLRTAWEQITNQCGHIHYENVESQDASNVDNKLYLLGVTETWNMQIKDLISIGLQVAMGMEYLSSLHVLHRDLAARNVLVCENGTIKVSDFGLSRDVYRDNVYCKTSSGKLPIRWLALESLTHQVYTTHSDVWSYGILLWEIITLGGNPYPGVQTHELLDLLLKGYRMNCPSNCSPELYGIMMSCWNTTIKERPSFTDIRHLLENILERKSEYMNLNLCGRFDSLDELKVDSPKSKSVSSERYVKAFAP